MNAPIFRSLATFGLALLAGCSATSTSFDWDTQFDFAALATWAWDPSEPGGEPNDLSRKRISTAIDATLAARGFRKVDDSPDFLVAWSVSTRDRVRASDWSGYRGPQRSYWTGYYDDRPIDVVQYEEGSLIIDVVEPDDARLVWRGTATRALDRSVSPDEASRIVDDAVERIFAGFPPSD